MTDLAAPTPALADDTVELDVDGQRYRIQLPDAATDYIQKKVATERRPYELEMLEEMRRHLRPGDLVVDAGANVGNHTIFLAAVAGCRVEAFEPNAALAAAIRASAALNGFEQRVHVHTLALGAQAARGRFDGERPDNLGAQKLVLDGGEVEVVTLDSLRLDGPVKALKIDVEGMELAVLDGAAALVERDRPAIYVECIGDRDFRAVARWLDARGYVHWDTFNATPTHEFLPAETVPLERRLARLQLKSVQDDYRQAALATNIRQKLTRALDNERQAHEQSATLTRELAVRDTELKQACAALEAARTELADVAGRRDRERRQAAAHEAAAQAELTAAQSEAQSARTEATQAQSEAQSARAEAAHARSAATALEQRLAETAADADRARTALQACVLERDAARSAQQAGAAAFAALRSEQATIEAALAAARATERELQQRLAALDAEGQALHGRITDATADAQSVRADRDKLQRLLDAKSARLDAIELRLERTRSSGSFLVGAALAEAARSPGAALRLPQRLWQIHRGRAQRRALAHTTVPAPTPERAPPAPPAAKPPPASAARAATAAAVVAAVPQPAARPAAVLREFASLRELRVACIADEFTFHSFAPECELLQLRADTWRVQLEAFKPDLVFIESAWRGIDDTWHRKVSEVSPELIDVLEWAMHARVPTAFWCKEDPVHFVRFLPVARLVDHVFTTDIDCIPRYMAALKHERVHLLPFAAQPALHHPVETFPREDAFCFAGSYYRKYPERQADFHELVKVGRKLRSVVIYDRNSNRPQPHDFDYPDEYRAELRDSLDYAEVDRAYKGYRFGITVNTIKQSQTMFARRAFELMACNTVVVSNFSRGLRMLFGDLVVSSDNPRELEQRLAPVCADERRYRALRLRALRCVLGEHTYGHRLAYMVTRIAERPVAPPRPKVAVVAEVATTADANRIAEAFRRQTWRDAALLLVGAPGAVPAGVTALADRAALAAALEGHDHVAVFDPRDHHGPDYLTDLALATSFARDDGVTKTAHYRADPAGGVQLHGDGEQYKPVAAARLRRSLVRVDAFRRTLPAAPACLGDAEAADGRYVSLDEFGYCEAALEAGAAFDPTAVEAIGSGHVPDYATSVLRTAEAVTTPTGPSDADEPHFKLSANELARLLPRQTDPRVSVGRDAQQRVVIESRLGPDQHTYLYLNRRFLPDELMSATEMRFELEADAQLNLCTVFVFRNPAEQKISQLTDTVGKPHALRTPAGTDHVRLALRVQGPGRAALGRLRIAPAHHEPIQAIPTVEHLVVARNYPAYDDLYRYAFVHARVRAYARAGQPAHVLCLGTDSDARFREFEDVDVTEADAATLDHFLASRAYRNVLVHLADPGIWEVVSRHLDDVRVTIWVHGAEIQPWWRRLFGEPDVGNDFARRTNDARLEMWREVLRLRHPNLTLVFISAKQLREALGDLRLTAAQLGRVEVIHNYIDTERFRYTPKPAEQRKRVLSIRPYSSPVYGNDLAVQAILRLADEPFFGDLQFRLVGDGKLFDATVAPLRGLPNVEITQGFITQAQIAELHREHGVFLVPSRMDSQGVSRDEAMSSGLVPVTNRVAAIPEFVDPSCGFLAEPEDVEGLARAIATLYHDPQRFEAMSAAAAQRVRGQSGYAHTVARELALLAPDRPATAGDVGARLAAEESARTNIAVYGDVNLNIVDGSAIWAASLAETLAGDDVHVLLLLKARIKRTVVLAPLLDLAPRVQLVEPPVRESEVLAPAQAVAEIAALAAAYPLRAVVLRGLQVCDEATRVAALRGRIWAYLTDIPQRADEMDDATRARIASIIGHSEFVLCQTPQMEAYLQRLFPAAVGRTRILPPMIPAAGTASRGTPAAGPFRVAYAGKFAPRWGIDEMFAAHAALRASHPDAELHVYGDKIHQSADAPEFRDAVQARLQGGNGVVWHGAVDRGTLVRELATMHACWAFRDPAFERECLELSTKALEYASLRVPVILARGAVNESVFGVDYPLFADSADQASALLRRLAAEPEFRAGAVRALASLDARFSFDAVRTQLRHEGVLPALSAA
jgi:FkbM family methyltransferase